MFSCRSVVQLFVYSDILYCVIEDPYSQFNFSTGCVYDEYFILV